MSFESELVSAYAFSITLPAAADATPDKGTIPTEPIKIITNEIERKICKNCFLLQPVTSLKILNGNLALFSSNRNM